VDSAKRGENTELLVAQFNPSTNQQWKSLLAAINGANPNRMRPHIYHRGLMVGETPNIDRIGNEGGIFMSYYAEQTNGALPPSMLAAMSPLANTSNSTHNTSTTTTRAKKPKPTSKFDWAGSLPLLEKK
jgi:hypothetical protein